MRVKPDTTVTRFIRAALPRAAARITTPLSRGGSAGLDRTRCRLARRPILSGNVPELD